MFTPARLMLVATLLLATPSLLHPPARTGRIAGHVRDAAGQPLSGAQVAVVGTRFTAVTDRIGAYAIESVPEGAYSVQARFIGYAQLELHGIRVIADSITTADFALQPSSTALQAVVATGMAKSARAYSLRAAVARDESAYRVRREPWNTEDYGHKDENPFLAVSAHPLSTFSIDVDRASYSNVRRFLFGGQAPPMATPGQTPSTDFRFQEAVAEFGLLLKNSAHKGSASLADVSSAARASLGDDPDGYRAEFLRLVAAAQSLGLARTEEPR